jgi:hypothetical protein
MACARCNADRSWEECAIQRECEEGMMLALVDCEGEHERRARGGKNAGRKRESPGAAAFTLAAEGSALFDAGGHGLEGRRLQVQGADLCLHGEAQRHIVLRRCDAVAQEQRFLGVRPGGQAMELSPLVGGTFRRNGTEHGRCLTQHHHPKHGERIYAGACDKARRSDTNLWSTY